MNAQATETTLMESITKASPPVGVSAMMFAGIPLNTWVLILTALYTALQIFFLVRDKIYVPWAEKRKLAKAASSTESAGPR